MAADDLVSRLSETLDELERVARAATDGPWVFDGDAVDVEPSRRSGEYIARYVGDSWGDVKPMLAADGVHIALWDPRAVLRLVAGLRELIEKYQTAQTTVDVTQGTVLAGAMKINQRARLEAIQILAAGFGITEEPS